MTDEVEPRLSERYRKTSVWPVFVALGVVISEVGVVLGLFPITVGGLLLFGATLAGILHEAGYLARPATALVVLGAVLGVLGAGVVLAQLGLDGLSLAALVDRGQPFVYRGTAIAVAGATLVALAGALELSAPR